MDKRERIIQSAIKLFSLNGFQATSTTSITKDAGVGTGTLFMYFKNKDALINTIYSEVKEQLAIAARIGVDERPTLKSQLKQLWVNMLRWSTENGAEFRFAMQFDNSPYIDKMTRSEASGGFNFILEIIGKGIQEDILVSYNAEFLFQHFIAQVYSCAHYIVHKPDQFESIADQSFIILWKGISS